MSITGKNLRSPCIWRIRQQHHKPVLDVVLTSAIYSFAPRIRFLRPPLHFEVSWHQTTQLTHTVHILMSCILGSIWQE